MKTEYDVGQTVWSKEYEESVTIAEIQINKQGITYIDSNVLDHASADLLAEKPLITREQFDKVMEELWFHPESHMTDTVWEVVQECIKEVQE